jgi:hypothetical protein
MTPQGELQSREVETRDQSVQHGVQGQDQGREEKREESRGVDLCRRGYTMGNSMYLLLHKPSNLPKPAMGKRTAHEEEGGSG